MSLVVNFLYLLKGFLFPSSCALCGCPLLGVIENRYGLCEGCLGSFAPDSGPACCLCGKPLISELDACLSCREEGGRSYDRLWALYPYAGKYRRLLAAYKFGKNASLAGFLIQAVSAVVESDPVLKDAVIVPVPPRPGKIKETGWDQVDYLVSKLEKSSGGRITVSRCLKRGKSKAQKKLSRKERLENLQGRICLRKPPPKIALVIDDVITTGSTLEVCAGALKAGGSEKAYGLCLFYG